MIKRKRLKVALFGGSFDPPHNGHIEVAQRALEQLDIDKIVVVPAWRNPFKSATHTDAATRYAWVEDSFDGIDGVVVSSYEIRANRPMPTIDTLIALSKIYDVTHLIIGADNLNRLQEWHRFTTLNSLVTWVVATRDAAALIPVWLNRAILLHVDMPISSTRLRQGKAGLTWLHPAIRQSFCALNDQKNKG